MRDPSGVEVDGATRAAGMRDEAELHVRRREPVAHQTSLDVVTDDVDQSRPQASAAQPRATPVPAAGHSRRRRLAAREDDEWR